MLVFLGGILVHTISPTPALSSTLALFWPDDFRGVIS